MNVLSLSLSLSFLPPALPLTPHSLLFHPFATTAALRAFPRLPTAARRNSPAMSRHRLSPLPPPRSHCSSRRSARPRRTRDAIAFALSRSLRDALLRVLSGDNADRRGRRSPRPQRSVAGADSAASRRLPSVSGKMGAPRRAVA